MIRFDGRGLDELRPVKVEMNYLKFAQSSVLISYGETKVLTTATVEEGVPPFLDETVSGWLTAEYGMIPASCGRRIRRPGKSGSDGRAKEIQRLVGRSLRSIVDLSAFPGKTVIIDCDVLQGDGGTRTASITGSFLACRYLFEKLKKEESIEEDPIKELLASVSVGLVEGKPMLDLCYKEDSEAEVDMNVVMTETGNIVEVQSTGEKRSFSKNDFFQLFDLAEKGIMEIIKIEEEVINSFKFSGAI